MNEVKSCFDGEQPKKQSAVEGMAGRLSRWGAAGWVWASVAPDKSLEVEAIIDGKSIGRATADQLRSDLASSDMDGGRYDFTLIFELAVEGDVVTDFRVSAPNETVALPCRKEFAARSIADGPLAVGFCRDRAPPVPITLN